MFCFYYSILNPLTFLEGGPNLHTHTTKSRQTNQTASPHAQSAPLTMTKRPLHQCTHIYQQGAWECYINTRPHRRQPHRTSFYRPDISLRGSALDTHDRDEHICHILMED